MFKRLILVAVLALYLMFLSTEIIDFAEAKGLKDSVVAAWSFDGNFKDMTDNGHDGEKMGKTKFVDGKFGKAISLSGKGDGVTTPELPEMDEVTDSSVSESAGEVNETVGAVVSSLKAYDSKVGMVAEIPRLL